MTCLLTLRVYLLFATGNTPSCELRYMCSNKKTNVFQILLVIMKLTLHNYEKNLEEEIFPC